jgi:spermidine dehydrogenase
VVTANVTLRRAAPLVDLGLGYQCYWWGSEHRADFVVADWTSASRHDRERSTVLTFYGSNTTPAAEIHNARIKLLQTPFAEYENTLRTDLSRVLAGIDFDFDRDVTAIYVYRWGHGMVMPTLGSPLARRRCKDARSPERSPRAIAPAGCWDALPLPAKMWKVRHPWRAPWPRVGARARRY